MGVANPEGKQAKEVLKKLIPVLTSGGKKIVFGALERRAAAGEILNMGGELVQDQIFSRFQLMMYTLLDFSDWLSEVATS